MTLKLCKTDIKSNSPDYCRTLAEGYSVRQSRIAKLVRKAMTNRGCYVCGLVI